MWSFGALYTANLFCSLRPTAALRLISTCPALHSTPWLSRWPLFLLPLRRVLAGTASTQISQKRLVSELHEIMYGFQVGFYAYVCIDREVSVCTGTYMYMYIYIHTPTNEYISLHIWNHIYIYTHTYAYEYIHTHTYTYSAICVYVCVYSCNQEGVVRLYSSIRTQIRLHEGPLKASLPVPECHKNCCICAQPRYSGLPAPLGSCRPNVGPNWYP